MASSSTRLVLRIMQSCVEWFQQIIDATGLSDVYIFAVFMALSCGFLLSAFRNGVSSGLDAGSDSAAKAYKARSSRPYRLNHKHKVK